MLVIIEDVAILRRTVYARRVVPEALARRSEGELAPAKPSRKGPDRGRPAAPHRGERRDRNWSGGTATRGKGGGGGHARDGGRRRGRK